MKKFFERFQQAKNEEGFSLIELMVVVAILGILATIAIPNFQRFQARARQKAGQALLSGYYQAMKATHAEYTYYYGDFVSIGYKPEGEVAYRLTGANDGSAPAAVGMTTEAGCIATNVACTTPGYTGWTEGLSVVATTAGPATTRNAFVAHAAADLNGAAIDEWSIDQNKAFAVITNGLP
jgi:type IV pilus assembly protein PilA